MTDLTLEVRYTCPSNLEFSVQIPSASDSDKKYWVEYIAPEWTCQCPGHRFRGDCNHVKIAKGKQCKGYWDAFLGSGSPTPGICHCGEKLIPIQIGV